MLWLNRLSAVLSQPFDLISLAPSGEAPFRGRYLRFANAVFGIGRLVASGGEALVYEMVDLDASTLAGVVKVCRFPPGSPEYRRWAVPIRFEGNAYSRLADIELHPSWLLEVPGGLVKVQDYVALDPSDDWATGTPARPIYEPDLELTARLEIADGLLRQHGDHGVLLEARGMILAELERDEEAVVTLERAADLFRSESHAGVLRVAPLLAFCHRRLYHQTRWEGAGAVMSIPGLGSQVIYTDPEAAALEDSREDRSLYVGLEALDVEPYSIPNLVVVAEELMGSWLSVGHVESVLQAIERAVPGHPRAVEIRESLAAMVGARTAKRSAASATPSSGPDEARRDPDVAGRAPQPPGGEHQQDAAREPSPGEVPEGYMSRFERAYEPEPERGQTVEARVTSAYANLAVSRHAQAEVAARGALALDPNHAGANIALARVLCASDRLAEAESLITDAIGSMSSDGDIYAELGAIKLQAEKFEEARTILLRSLVSEPKDRWGVRFNLGKACRKLGRREEAVRWLRECAVEEPDRTFASIELAYALRGEPEPDVDEALRVVGQALARSPSDADLLVCQAQLLGMKGDWAHAIADLERAVASAPNHPVAAKFLAALRDPSSGIHV